MTTPGTQAEVSPESIRKTAFPGVALARDAKPLSPGAAGKTVDQSWPDLAAGGRPAYTGVANGDSKRKSRFNGKLRDECLNGEIFYSLREAQIVIEQWRIEYNNQTTAFRARLSPAAPEAIRPGENLSLIEPSAI